eukprot:3628221-Rhodomonas_salina.2
MSYALAVGDVDSNESDSDYISVLPCPCDEPTTTSSRALSLSLSLLPGVLSPMHQPEMLGQLSIAEPTSVSPPRRSTPLA